MKEWITKLIFTGGFFALVAYVAYYVNPVEQILKNKKYMKFLKSKTGELKPKKNEEWITTDTKELDALSISPELKSSMNNGIMETDEENLRISNSGPLYRKSKKYLLCHCEVTSPFYVKEEEMRFE